MNWISFKEDYPHVDEKVLCCDIESEITCLGRHNGEDDVFEIMSMDPVDVGVSVTHWTRLPKLPQG